VVAKAEHINGKENPRFVVTSLEAGQWTAQALYEELYCARGDRENRIKEQFSLFVDRVSAETMRANQMRLYFSVMAYVLMSGLRRLGLQATDWAQAQVSTIRTKLLKIGAQIRVRVKFGCRWLRASPGRLSIGKSGQTYAVSVPVGRLSMALDPGRSRPARTSAPGHGLGAARHDRKTENDHAKRPKDTLSWAAA